LRLGSTCSPQIQPRGRISIHGRSQPLAFAVRTQPTRVSMPTVPIRLVSSPGAWRTPTVRCRTSDRVPSGKSGATATGGSGTTGLDVVGGVATGTGTGGGCSILPLQPTTAAASTQARMALR
jgi:hypothetical protein